MLANVSLPSYDASCQMLTGHVYSLGLLMKKVSANVTQNSFSDSRAVDLVCVFSVSG